MRTNANIILGVILSVLGFSIAWVAGEFELGIVGYIGRALFLLGWAFILYEFGMRLAEAVKEKRDQ